MTQKKNNSASYSSMTGIHRAVPIILFAAAVFTMFCFITKDIGTGALGRAISSVFLGLFSYGAYAIPLLLTIHAIYYPSDITEKRVLSRVIFSLVAVTFISALSYSITYWNTEDLIFDAIQFFKDGQESIGGGFIGGIVGYAIIQVVDRVGLVIIAAAILAIYISYFFAKGQKGLSNALYNILKAIVIVLALIERGIKGIFHKAKSSKEEKIKRNADQKNIELTDDEFFAVDNGMQRLSVAELGIKEIRTEADAEGKTTLHDKVFHKSAVSQEEAEEMKMREEAEELYYQAMQDSEPEEKEPSAPPRRRIVNVTYDDPDSKIGKAPIKEDPTPEPVNEEVFNATVSNDDSADSIFTRSFDPFDMVISEELASKPSSKSLLDEKPRQTQRQPIVTEDISELTEAEIEREKRILEFERRKAEIIGKHRPIPVDNDGEFTGTQKTVEFRERSSENLNEKPEETRSSSFVFNKAERSFEAPKAEPANYTAIGFGSEIGSFSAPKTDNEYARTESEHSAEVVSSFTFTKPIPADPINESIPTSTPYVEEEATPLFEKKIDANPYSAYRTASDPTPTVYEKTDSTYGQNEQMSDADEPAYSMDRPFNDRPDFSYSAHKAAPIYQNTSAFGTGEPKVNNVPNAEQSYSEKPDYSYTAPKSEPVNTNSYAYGYTESKAEPASVNSSVFGYTAPKGYEQPTTEQSCEEKPDFTYTATKDFGEAKQEYVPEFKPYQVTKDEEITSPEVNVITIEEKSEPEPVTTLKIEREYVGDDPVETEVEDGSNDYGYEDEEYSELGDVEEMPEDDSPFEDEEIPPEQQNPVVQGYKDMFSALRTDADEPEEEEANESADEPYESGYDEQNDEPEDEVEDDEPPFEHTTVKPEPKAQKKEEEKPVKQKPDFSSYNMPPIDLLGLDPVVDDDTSEINENTKILIDTLASFNVTASIKGVDRGPRITRYEVVPARGVKVNSITNLFNDIKLNLAKEGIRMEAPIPGKSAIGFEIPNKRPKNVRLRELIECEEFSTAKSKTFVAIGKDVAGNPVFGDISKYPHALICGATGMGKSVCINSILVSMLYKARPDEVKLIMIDPKKVEFKMYSGIPHLLIPVITESKQAAGALMWAVEEMERRYETIEAHNVRNIEAYNEKVSFNPAIGEPLPKIIIVIDELADLMMQVRDPVEDLIMRIAQKARAAGIHLLIGTQRPSVQIITGAIKANIPSRVSCKVTSQVDSRTIFDMKGAEELLSRGDMLYWPVDRSAALRVQGAFVSDREVEEVMEYLKSQVAGGAYDDEVFEEINKAAQKCGNKKSGGVSNDDIEDEGEECGYYSDQQFLDAVELAIRSKKVSTSLLQRKLSIGYGKAAKYIDAMEEIGIVSEPRGQKPRDVLLTLDEWHEKLSRVEF